MIHLILHLNHDFIKQNVLQVIRQSNLLFIAIPHLMHVVSPNSHPLRKTNNP
ncbi:hypothetical protein GIB67_015794, partial [Kingdonia uniflora]